MTESKLNLPDFDEVKTEKPKFWVTIYCEDDDIFFERAVDLEDAENLAKKNIKQFPGSEVHIMKSYVVFKTETVVKTKRYHVA